MPTATRTFRVFVSSTFEDLKEERNALAAQGGPFAELTKLCQSFGARFQAIDLRWGVRDEAALDQRTIEICLGEIERCQRTGIKPNFIILLGDRYGWRPVPARIDAEEYQAVRERIANAADQKLVDEWYQLDTNAVPPEYLLRPRTGEFRDKDRWDAVEATMHKVLREAAHAAGLSGDALIKYEASVTHQEILNGLGKTPEDCQHVFAFFRTGKQPSEEPELTALKIFLRARLGNNVYEPQSVTELCDRVRECLERVILAEVQRFGSHTALGLERKAHNAFARSRRRHFQGREPVLKAVAEYAKDTDQLPLVLHGMSGSGKSAAMAQAAALATAGSRNAITIRRFIGVTPESSNGVTLLRSLCDEIAQRCGGPPETPIEFNPLVSAFRDRLALATADRPLHLFIDALDQLGPQDPARSLMWLPVALPPHCRMVLSTIDVPPTLHEAKLVEVGLFPAEDAEGALSAWLQDARRTLRDEQRAKVLAYFKRCGLPLYLKLSFEEARRWRSFYEPDACVLGDGLAGIIDVLFDRLALDANHGKVLVSRGLGYLAAARYGLTEDEIVDVLSDDNEVWKEFLDHAKHDPPQRRLPVIIWSRLFLDLEPYLTERAVPGGTAVSFYHRQLPERVTTRWVSGSEAKARHEMLMSHFGDQAHWLGEPWRQPNARKTVELVYQQWGAGRLGEASSTLTDLGFVAAKCAAGLVFDLQEDYRQTIEILPEAQRALAAERSQQGRMAKFTLDLAAYARGGIKNLEVPESVEPWSDARIVAEVRRIRESATDLDRLRVFAGFVQAELYPLVELAARAGFVVQHGFNSAPAGPIHTAADAVVSKFVGPLLLRIWPEGADYIPKAALLRTLEGHTGWVNSVSVTADGRRAVSGGSDKTLRVWDLESGQCVRTLEVAMLDMSIGGVSVSVTPDGRRAVSGIGDTTVRVWDIETGQCLLKLEGHTDYVSNVSVTADGRRAVSASHDQTLRVWDLETGQCLHRLEGHRSHVGSVTVTADGRRAVSAGWIPDTILRVWDLEIGLCLRTLEGHRSDVLSVSMTPDGRRAVSTDWNGFLRVWDLEMGLCMHTLEGAGSHVSVTADGRWAVSGGRFPASTLQVWDLEVGHCVRKLNVDAEVSSVSVTPDGRRAVSGGMDMTVRLWNLESGQCPRQERHTSEILSISVTPDGRRAVSGSKDNTVRVWDPETGACLHTLEGHTGWVESVSVASDGRRAMSAGAGPEGFEALRVWNLETGQCLRILNGQTSVSSVNVMPDGRRAVSGGKDRVSGGYDYTLRLWDLETGKCERTLEIGGQIYSLGVTPEGWRAISASYDNTLRVWDLDTGQCIHTIATRRGMREKVTAVNLTPRGRRAVSGSSDGTLRVWDLEREQCLQELEGHTKSVVSMSLTPDGRRAVSRSDDCTLRVWDLDTGQCLHTLDTQQDSQLQQAMSVKSVSVTPDGRRAVSTDWNCMRVWDIDSGECLALVRFDAPCWALDASSPNRILAGTVYGEVLFFHLHGIPV